MTTSVKTCFKCKAQKPLTEFYKHSRMADGHLNKCKDCTRKDVIENRQEKIDYYQNYDRKRYRTNDKRRKKTVENFRKRLTPAMQKACAKVTNAIRSGTLERKPCEVCGKEKAEAHHVDYLKPLDVMWLCRSHHVKWHKKHGKGKNFDAVI